MSLFKNRIQKHFRTLCMGLFAAAMLGGSGGLQADNSNIKVGLVNFKEAIEKSKLGQQEQETYDNMKKQIETILTEKEEEFQKISKKLQDEDFRDSQKPEALQKLQEQYQQLGTELAQGQQQYYQALQQANYKILQKIADVVSKASKSVADDKSLDLILNDDNSFYNSPRLDITPEVIAEMDRIAAEELKDAANSDQSGNMDTTK